MHSNKKELKTSINELQSQMKQVLKNQEDQQETMAELMKRILKNQEGQ